MPTFKQTTLPLMLSALFFAACGDKSETPAESSVSTPSSVKEAKMPDAPAESIEYVLHSMADGNGAVLWQAMPASYQSELNSIAQLAGAKIDAEIYDQVFATFTKLSEVLDKQKEFVFNTDMMGEQADPEQVAQLREAWPSVMNLFKTITTSPVSTVSGLQAFDGEAFFTDTVSSLLSSMDALAKLQPERDDPLLSDLKEAEVKYVEGTDTEALLELSMPNEEPETQAFVKVEDRWVPKEMAEQWDEEMAGARAALEGINPEEMAQQKPQIMSVFAMINGVLTQVEAAESQEQFDQALQGAMMPIMGLMMMGQGLGGAGGAGGAAPAMPQMPPMPAMPVSPPAQ